ncbi:hypothetical protein [Vibrio comitans]
MKYKSLFLLLSVLGLVACSNNPPLGTAVALVKNEQIYNPQATEDNKDVLPEGDGERAQVVIKGYNKSTSKNYDVGTGFSN